MRTTARLTVLLAAGAACASALALPASAATPTPTPSSTTGCQSGAVPAQVVGNPGVQPHQAAAVYLWHGKDGYGLRATHPGTGTLVISGRITVSNKVTALKKVHVEKQDTVNLSKDGTVLTFRFVDHGLVDGFDFAAECSKDVHVDLVIGGHRASPSQVHLGTHRAAPTSVPFTVERATPATAAAVA